MNNIEVFFGCDTPTFQDFLTNETNDTGDPFDSYSSNHRSNQIFMDTCDQSFILSNNNNNNNHTISSSSSNTIGNIVTNVSDLSTSSGGEGSADENSLVNFITSSTSLGQSSFMHQSSVIEDFHSNNEQQDQG